MCSSSTLLLEISRCPVVSQVFAGDISHACSKVVRSQSTLDISAFQVPEPWNGNIEHAPLLFVSSNPSISMEEEYPIGAWPNDQIEDFFHNRFGGGRRQWVRNGTQALTKEGVYLRSTPYWSEIRNRATELFGRRAIPGIDYAITEIVHCKSVSNIGVPEAARHCIERYLSRVLEVSVSSVVVAVGDKAGPRIRGAIRGLGDGTIAGPMTIGGRRRLVLFLPAPGSSKPRTIRRVLTEDELSLVRSFLS